MSLFHVVSPYSPSGDQPEAIETLVGGIKNGIEEQVLLGEQSKYEPLCRECYQKATKC